MQHHIRSLEVDLKTIVRYPPRWLPEASVLPFARACLGVDAAHERQWYREARWGYFAQRLVGQALFSGRAHQLAALVEPVDWSLLRSLRSKGKGVILVSYHLGPWQSLIQEAMRSEFPVVPISAAPDELLPENSIAVRDGGSAKTALARSLLHLRRNGVILASPEGRSGARHTEIEFLGQRITLFSGIGELAQVSGAETCLYTATWAKTNRIRITLGPLISPRGAREVWLSQWNAIYLQFLRTHMRSKPADLGFRFGLWDTPQGGLQWVNYGSNQ